MQRRSSIIRELSDFWIRVRPSGTVHGPQCRGNGRVETCDARLLRTDTGMTKGNW